MDEAVKRAGLISRLARLFGRGDTAAPRTGTASSGAAQAAAPSASVLPPVSAGTACFRVRTAAGRVLCLQGDAPAWLETAPSLDPAAAIVAVIPAARHQACVLLSPDGRAFEIHADPARGFAASALVLQTDTPGIVRLRHPLVGPHYLTSDAAGALRFDGAGDTMQAVFALVPVPHSDLSSGLQATAAEIGRAIAGGLRMEPLLDGLRSGAIRPDLAQSLLRLMPEEELAELARRLLARPADLAMVRHAVPDDAWIDTYLPALAAWRAERAPVAQGVTQSPASDEALLLPTDGNGLVPLGLAVHSLARRQILPRRTACLVAAVRNEGPYLLDWISYHLSIGFEHVFLYANENEDGSDELLDLLARHGVITLVRNERSATIGPQIKGYAHALTMLPQTLDFRWTALLDLDEYICFDPMLFSDITDYIGLQECQRVDAIALSWVMFAGLPEDRWSGISTPARFTRRERNVHELVKSLIRTRMFWFSQPHFPTGALKSDFDYRGPDGSLHHHRLSPGRGAAVAPDPSANHAWINHYMLRSAEEALWKWSRGRGDLAAGNPESLRPLDFIAGSFLSLARPEHLVDDRRILDCARRQGPVLDSILRLPGMAECNAAIGARFKEKLAVNTRLFLSNPLPPDASGSVVAFRRLVAEQHASA